MEIAIVAIGGPLSPRATRTCSSEAAAACCAVFSPGVEGYRTARLLAAGGAGAGVRLPAQYRWPVYT
jgi:hypothetical protein